MGSKTVNGFVINDGIHKQVEDMIYSGVDGLVYDCDTWDAVARVLPRDVTDAVLAWVAARLTSPEAVRAGATAITSDPNFGENTWPDDARVCITAALQQAGITKGEGDGAKE